MVRSSDGAVVVERLELARGFFSRARGLMGRAALPPGGGLLIEPCSSIHMMFMRFPLDVVFLRAGRVVGVRARLRPWLGLAACRGATAALEVGAGEAARHCIAEGDELVVEGGDEREHERDPGRGREEVLG